MSYNVPTLPPEGISRFLEAKGVDPKCPACHQNDWSVQQLGAYIWQGIITLEAKDGSRTEVRGGSMAAIALICNNCAFLRPHAYQAIADWLKDNPE